MWRKKGKPWGCLEPVGKQIKPQGGGISAMWGRNQPGFNRWAEGFGNAQTVLDSESPARDVQADGEVRFGSGEVAQAVPCQCPQ